MTDKENYAFDVAGYLVVRNVLTSEEVDACNCALEDADSGSIAQSEAFVRLREHPILTAYLDQLIADKVLLDCGPWVVGEGDSANGLVGGNEPREPSRAYYFQNGIKFCQGMLAIWALSDVHPGDGGFVLVPASHKSSVETPSDLMSGANDMELVYQPALKAGDLLLCVETILHRFVPGQGALVAYGYSSETALRNLAQADQSLSEGWASEMTPLQRAVMLPAGCPDDPPVLTSDGETCEIAETSGVFHPSIYGRDLDCGIDEKELYQWDLCGHLILRNVMDAEWLAAANEAIDQYADQIVVGGNAAKGSQALAGTGVPSFRGLFELPKPHCDAFREMVAHPAVVQRMNWMMGSGFRCRNARAICSMKGTSGHALHSGTEPVKPKNTYVFQNGRTYCDSINVAWQLRDVQEEDGGFVCIPGSHKARYPVPEDLKSCEDTMDIVRHVGMQAGDVMMFLGAAQTHGAYPWKSEVDRRAVLLGYSSRNIT